MVFLTNYTYDALNHLTGVTQNAQPNGTPQSRSYSYDAMTVLTSETNPESGTTVTPTMSCRRVAMLRNAICRRSDSDTGRLRQ